MAFARKEDSGNLPAVLNGGGFNQLRPDGTFEFRDIVPGTYVLQVLQVISVNGNPPANVTGRVEVTVGDANIDDLVLPLVPGPEITGTVKLEDGDIATLLKPAQNTPGSSRLAGNARVRVALAASCSDAERNRRRRPGEHAQRTGEGRRHISIQRRRNQQVPAERAFLPQGTYLKSARFGGQDVTHAPIDTTSGTGGTLELVLSSKAADVTGSVQNDKGEALAGVMVTLWPKTPDASSDGRSPAGHYRSEWRIPIPGSRAGRLLRRRVGGSGARTRHSADFLSHFTSDASAIKLAEGGHESRDLKPVPSDKIAVEIAKLP